MHAMGSMRHLVRKDLNELLALEPYLRPNGFENLADREENETRYYPPYPQKVEEFINLVIRRWCVPNYDPDIHGRMLVDDEIIASASLEQIRSMLTFCIRSERFGEGNLGALIAEGRVAALLSRLTQLGDEFAETN